MYELPAWLLSVLTVYLIVWTLLGLAFTIGAIVLVVKIKGVAGRVSKQVEEITGKVKTSAERVTETVNVIADRAQRVSETAEATVDRVAEKVDATTDLIRDSVATPVINVSALAAGVRKGLETWVERRRGRREADSESSD